MFTRINVKFSSQNEMRIILGGENIPDKTADIKGYKVKIPKISIRKIYVSPNTPEEFIEMLKELDVEIKSLT